MKKLGYIFILALALFNFGCTQDAFFEKFNTVDNREWKANQKAQFSVDVTDTLTKYDFLIHIRTTTDYPYNNLFVKVGLIDPDGVSQSSVIPIQMTGPNGWLGKNTGSLITTSYAPWARQNFKKAGTYIFEVEQMMQDSILHEVTDVGFAIYESEGAQ